MQFTPKIVALRFSFLKLFLYICVIEINLRKMKKMPIKKKDFTRSIDRVDRVYHQIIDYQNEHDCYVTIDKDNTGDLLFMRDISIKKEDLENSLVQKFLKELSEQLQAKDNA